MPKVSDLQRRWSLTGHKRAIPLSFSIPISVFLQCVTRGLVVARDVLLPRPRYPSFGKVDAHSGADGNDRIDCDHRTLCAEYR